MATYQVSETTKAAMAAALRELMAHKSLEKITIGEIMESCGMRRQHFYYYFTDIYDLLRWMFQRDAAKLLASQKDELHWQDGLLQLFHYLDENRAVCLCALNSWGNSQVKHFFEPRIYELVLQAIQHLIQVHAFPTTAEQVDTIAHFLTIAMAGLTERWLRGEIRQDPEDMIALLDGIFLDYIRGVTLRLKGPQEALKLTSTTPARKD